ncbi:MAG: MogA/MoaB family molybdenum cofactor biosynthesis protein [Cryobacterium sp.]|nr:MogA/MoaB family molybdenum cofactor biosynthesis protein [Cryobacterium sp.]MBX3090779.1 MogA/MoaB family molybdenum cofactor biosynthesis protein [Cryobacterium sp.]
MSESREKAAVITVSDRSARGEREDSSGPMAVALLEEAGFDVDYSVIPDGADTVAAALRLAIDAGVRLIITSGGTGVSPRDRTPEGTRDLLALELPGVSEALRRSSPNRYSVLSRGLVGVAGDPPKSLVANLPGSVKAVEEGLEVLLPLVPHLLDQLSGGDHG